MPKERDDSGEVSVVMHYVNHLVKFDPKLGAIFDEARTARGFREMTFSSACKWWEVLVDAESVADELLQRVSMARKAVK